MTKRACLLATFFVVSVSAYAHGISGEDFAKYVNGGPLVYLELGARHILTGYDHLLFLVGVVFYVTRFADIVKLITAFTVGHSLTLAAATYFQIEANYFLIDALVALTVCYKAFDNLDGFRRWIGIGSPNLHAAVFGFGLIHGFGLSARLQQLPLGHQALVARIAAFNLGVELGQIAALAIIGAVLVAWRRTPSFEKSGKVANGLLLIVGGLLFLYQLHGYVHAAYPEDFPLNQHEHEHLHQEVGHERQKSMSGDPIQQSAISRNRVGSRGTNSWRLAW